jgi:hypothetical protein
VGEQRNKKFIFVKTENGQFARRMSVDAQLGSTMYERLFKQNFARNPYLI